jgi:predicted HAD superfamily Cof-like phosphohydrolase
MRMMHDYYGVHESIEKLPKEHLQEYLKFRFRFLQEELDEGIKAIEEKDPEEVVDALIDLIVVAAGTLDVYQVNFKKAWYEVLNANMNKEVGIKASRPNPWGLPDLIKRDDWVPPSHKDNHGLLTKTLKD